MIIAIIGHRATGKDTAADILAGFGFEPIGFSEQIANVAIEHDWMDEHERRDKRALSAAALRIRAELGPEAYLERMVRDNVVLSGLRDPRELSFLRSTEHELLVIGLTASDELRLERARSLGIVSSLEELHELESKPADAHIDELLDEADVLIENDGALDGFRSNLERVIGAARAHRL